jgi:hypothetical protein
MVIIIDEIILFKMRPKNEKIIITHRTGYVDDTAALLRNSASFNVQFMLLP